MLKVQDVSCDRSGQILLEHVTFDVSEGEIIALVGPNGIGKTTLLRSIAGVQPVSQGQITHPEGGLVYASHLDAVKEALTVHENLHFWAHIYGHDVTQDVYEYFDLSSLQMREARSLSAGQKRRLSLARLAVTGQKLFLLDEPTVSLDAASVQLFSRYMRDVHCAQGGAAVIATHLELAMGERSLDLSQFQVQRPRLQHSDEIFL